MPINKYTGGGLKKLKKGELLSYVVELYGFIDLFDGVSLTKTIEENEKLKEENKKLKKRAMPFGWTEESCKNWIEENKELKEENKKLKKENEKYQDPTESEKSLLKKTQKGFLGEIKKLKEENKKLKKRATMWKYMSDYIERSDPSAYWDFIRDEYPDEFVDAGGIIDSDDEDN